MTEFSLVFQPAYRTAFCQTNPTPYLMFCFTNTVCTELQTPGMTNIKPVAAPGSLFQDWRVWLLSIAGFFLGVAVTSLLSRLTGGSSPALVLTSQSAPLSREGRRRRRRKHSASSAQSADSA